MRLDLAGYDSGNFIFMKIIPLSENGKYAGKYYAIIDDEDYDKVSRLKWYMSKTDDIVYARANGVRNGKPCAILMHRFVMDISSSDLYVDHRDRDSLNNQKSNLRIATNGQNGANRRAKKNGTSKYLGVSLK